MRRIIWTTSASVDGYMQGPNRDISWHMVDEELHGHFNNWLAEARALIEGRLMYELMADFWPTADQDPAATPTVVQFARIWRDIPKVVYSRTLKRADWNARVVHDFAPAEVLALKAQPGGDLVLGGPDLAAEFARHGRGRHACSLRHQGTRRIQRPSGGPDQPQYGRWQPLA